MTLEFVKVPTDPSAEYFGRCGPFVLCKAWVGDRWVFTASRVGERKVQLLHSGTREDCEAACEALTP